jgi:2-polyprenyl-3-methyl-5-hydroxy-6-metoxy-1,4-benzoquinol methylase
MEPHAFVAEVYRRMSLRHPSDAASFRWNDVQNEPRVLQATYELADLLPANRNAAILDLGFGQGWFLAACLKLGYSNLSGADFGIANKAFVKAWAPDAISLYPIESNIGDFLADKPEHYDFIHMSHVIEHLPKHSLLWVVDALYRALKRDGVLMLRTPNMEGPCANSSLFVTLGHEYGFSGSNLQSLLDICGFDSIRFHQIPLRRPTLKQRVGRTVGWFFLQQSRLKHRLFGVNVGGQFGSELVVTAKRGDIPPLFDSRYR